MVGRSEDLLFGPLFNDAAVEHDDNLVGDGFNRCQVVGNEQVGNLQLSLQAEQQLQYSFGHQLIQGRSNLVADDQVRLGGQGAGDADTLFFTAESSVG